MAVGRKTILPLDLSNIPQDSVPTVKGALDAMGFVYSLFYAHDDFLALRKKIMKNVHRSETY